MPLPIDVLVVDDNPSGLAQVRALLPASVYSVRTAEDGLAGWNAFCARKPDIVVSDIRMPKHDGIELLGWIRKVSDVPVILLTAHADLSAAVSALRNGATDFIRFPDELPELPERMRALLPDRAAREPNDAASRLLRGDAAVMVELRAQVRALARLDVPVLVVGEGGSGRATAVEAIHRLSGAAGPLVSIERATDSIPRRRCALLARDIGAWSAAEQETWALALREETGKRFTRLFATADIAIAARVDRGEFRRDLWSRFSRFRLDVPALRERPEDIAEFAREALSRSTRELGKGAFTFTPGALESLTRRPWPGNFSELRAAIDQAVAFAKGARIAREEIDRAIEAVIAAREDSLASRRAEKESEERKQLVALLAACNGNIAEVGRRLSLTRGAVTYRLKKHGLTR